MTAPGTPTGRPSRAVHGLLAALVGFLLVLAGIVVGTVPAAAQNAVGASTTTIANNVGPPADISAGQRLGNTSPQPQIVVATAVAADTGDALLSTASSGAGKALPMNMQTVCEVACKYNVDISDVTINIYKARAGYARSTASDGTITLTRSAFANEEQLARTLAHERFHVDQIRSGMGYRTSYDASNAWEQAARAYEDDWWAGQ